VDLLALLFAIQAPLSASTIEIPRIEDAEVVIDGNLDEPVWSQAARLTGFHQYEPVDGRPASEETEVLVWYAPDAIYFGIIAHDSEPEAIRATVADRDDIGGDDHITIYLDTFNDRRRAFFFAVNPLGVQQDGVRYEGGGFGGTDKSPDYWYESQGRITESGYIVEVKIPFKSLRYPSGDTPQSWGLQIERRTQRTGYVDTWTDTRRASASYLAQAGTITGLKDLERGVVFEAQPFITATADGGRDPVDGRYRRDSVDPEVGMNLRLGFTNLSLDATVNPDFSQVEADAGQVTVNERFALFFSEKRPFFLEGIELFQTPSQLVHTRQIVSPKVGGKVTGKVGGLSIAHLTALDDPSEGEEALVNITRLRNDFGSNSHTGLTFTDRTVRGGPRSNRVLAADLRYVFGGMYFAELQYGRSWTRVDEWTNAPIWKAEVDRTGRHIGFNYRLSGIADDFEADAGFIRRSGIIDFGALNRVSFYGGPGALIERVNIYVNPSRLWHYDEFGRESAIEGGEALNISFRMRGGWELDTNSGRNFYLLDPSLYQGYEVRSGSGWVAYDPFDRISGYGINIGLKTPTYRTFNASLSFQRERAPIFDEGAPGDLSGMNASLSLRPRPSIRINLSNTIQYLDRTQDGSEFARTIIPRARFEYQPNRALFFRAIGEWQAERRSAYVDPRLGREVRIDGIEIRDHQLDGLRLDLLVSYTPTPGTVAFFGYGTSLGYRYGDQLGIGPDPQRRSFDISRLERESDGFFVKLAYQFRR